MERKIIALCMGVNPSLVTESREKRTEALYDFGFIGRLTKKKGVHLFIEAINFLYKEGFRFQTVIAGDGEEMEDLKRMAVGMPIKFIGFVSDQAKLKFFKQVKICIFPSSAFKSDVEGLPVALLEALVIGKTIVASKDTNIELLPEWPTIKDTIYYLRDPHDTQDFACQLKEAASLSNIESEKKSASNQKALSRYSWENLIKEYLKPLKTTSQ
jgi:glycosyltransferase involved in cell wall biosynthesis